MEIILTEPTDETRQTSLQSQRANQIPCSPAGAGSPILSIFHRNFHILSGSDRNMMSPMQNRRQGTLLASSAFASVTNPLKIMLRAAGIDNITARVLACACDTPEQLRILIRKQPVEFATLVPPVADRIKIVRLLSVMNVEDNVSNNEPCFRTYRCGSTKEPELQYDVTKFIVPFSYSDDTPQYRYLNASTTYESGGEGAMHGPSICSITVPPQLLSITLAVPLTQANEEAVTADITAPALLRPNDALSPVVSEGAQIVAQNATNEPFSLRISDEEAPTGDEEVPSASPTTEGFVNDNSPVSAADLMTTEPLGLVLNSRDLKRVGRRGIRQVSVIHIDGNGNAIVGGGVVEYSDGTKIFDLHPKLTKFLMIVGIISSVLFVVAASCAIAALALPFYRGNRMRWSALNWSRGPSFMDPGSSEAQKYSALPLCDDIQSVLIGVFSLLLFCAVFALACAGCFLYFRRYNKVFLFLPTIPIIAMIPLAYMLFVHVMGIRGACGNRYAIIESEDYQVLRGTWMVVTFIATYIAAYCLRLGVEYAPVVCAVRFPLARGVTPTPPLMPSPSVFSPILASSSPLPVNQQGIDLASARSSERLTARRAQESAPIADFDTDSMSTSSSEEQTTTPRYTFHEPTSRPPAVDTVGASPPRFPPPPLRFRLSPSSPPRVSRQASHGSQGAPSGNNPF